METLLFWLLAVIALIAAASMIIQRNPVHSALFLIITLLSLAGLFLLLSAHFLAVIQVIVYAGAIMVLFLFVIMLLDIRRIEAAPSRVKLQKSLGILLGVVFFLETLLVLRSGVIDVLIVDEGNARAVLELGRATPLDDAPPRSVQLETRAQPAAGRR